MNLASLYAQLSELAENKEMGPSEIDDITAVGLEIL